MPRSGRHGCRAPRTLPLRAAARGEGGAPPARGGSRVQGTFPAGGRCRPTGQRGVHRARGGCRSGGGTALDGHPVRPRPDALRAGEAERADEPRRAAQTHGGTGRGAARHPPGRCHPPRSQAEQRAAPRLRAQGHRLRDLTAVRQRCPHGDGQADRLAAVHGARAVPAAPRGGSGRRRVRARGGAGPRGDGPGPVRLRQPLPGGLPGGARRGRSDGSAHGSRAPDRALPGQGPRGASHPGRDHDRAAPAVVRGRRLHTRPAQAARRRDG